MPIGLFLCFTPIVIAWVMAEMKQQPPTRDEKKH